MPKIYIIKRPNIFAFLRKLYDSCLSHFFLFSLLLHLQSGLLFYKVAKRFGLELILKEHMFLRTENTLVREHFYGWLVTEIHSKDNSMMLLQGIIRKESINKLSFLETFESLCWLHSSSASEGHFTGSKI